MNLFNTKVLENLELSKDELKDIQLNTTIFPQSNLLILYRLTSNNEKQVLVSLKDIVGYDTDENLYQIMDGLFDPKGDEYHSRSTRLFDLNINNFREKLFPELYNHNNKDPFKIREIRKWKI